MSLGDTPFGRLLTIRNRPEKIFTLRPGPDRAGGDPLESGRKLKTQARTQKRKLQEALLQYLDFLRHARKRPKMFNWQLNRIKTWKE